MEELLTVKEVASVLKTNVAYVHRLRKQGLLKFMKLGSLKCRRSTLDRFIRESEGFDLTNPENVKLLECNPEDREEAAGLEQEEQYDRN